MTRRPIRECAICRDLPARAGMFQETAGFAKCPKCASRYRRDGDRFERVLPADSGEPVVPADFAGALGAAFGVPVVKDEAL